MDGWIAIPTFTMEDNSEESSMIIKNEKESCALPAITTRKTKKGIKRSSTFLGVFAISRPKTIDHSRSSSTAATVFPVVQETHRREDTTISTRKRKRTLSDGCSSSQGSAVSLQPFSLTGCGGIG